MPNPVLVELAHELNGLCAEDRETRHLVRYCRYYLEAAAAICRQYDPNATVTNADFTALLADANRVALGRLREEIPDDEAIPAGG